jgi:hypothetical protein
MMNVGGRNAGQNGEPIAATCDEPFSEYPAYVVLSIAGRTVPLCLGSWIKQQNVMNFGQPSWLREQQKGR